MTTFIRHARTIASLLLIALAPAALAQDWTQWRGAERTGVATGGPKLIDSVPATGLKLAWRSEPIIDTVFPGGRGSDVGFSSPVAAGGRVYLYLNQRVKDDSPLRLTWGVLDRLGCFAAPLPKDLLAKVEAARRSAERAALKSDEVPAWAEAWAARNLGHAQFAAHAADVVDRLGRGAEAVPLETLDRLVALKDKPFAKREELAAALAQTGLDRERSMAVIKELTGNRQRALDVLFCFDVATGRTVWKKEYPGALFEYGSSSTPCIAGDRIYVSGGKVIYCFDLKSGAEIWQVPCPAREVSSSPLVAEGILLIQAESLCALDSKDGSLLWTRPECKGIHPSPTLWRKDGITYVVQNGGMAELHSGKLMWKFRCDSDSSPVVSGDRLVVAQLGLTICYHLALDKPEELWKLTGNGGIAPSTPVILDGYLYGTKSQSGPLSCVELATGKVQWSSPPGENYGCAAFNTGSMICVDGTLLLDAGSAFYLVRAKPEAFELLWKCKMTPSNRTSTPTLMDGRLFIRAKDALECYDLRQ